MKTMGLKINKIFSSVEVRYGVSLFRDEEIKAIESLNLYNSFLLNIVSCGNI